MRTSIATSGCSLVCAAALLMLWVPAEAGKPTKPPAPDPCENMNQPGAWFPSYVFSRPIDLRVASWGVFLADSTGKCERLVTTFSNSGNVGKTLDLQSTGPTGLVVGERRGFAIEALSFSITFDPKGIPAVTTAGFNDILGPTDLPASPLAPAGWQTTYLFNPRISADGTRILFVAYDQNLSAMITWICSFDSSLAAGSVSACRSVYFDAGPEHSLSSWGIDSQTVYYTDQAGSGSGNSVYRMTLPDWDLDPLANPVVDEIWGRGTLFREVRAGQFGGVELLAVSEVSAGGDGCNKVYVVDVATCASSGCADTNIVNGAGHPARWAGWLRSGRLVAEGQSAPSRRGVCTATNKVVTFERDNLTGTVTVLGDGYQPDGAGSG